jgi:hypothetical protein
MKNEKQAIIDLTLLMNSKEKFSFMNISKYSIVALNKKNENSFPNHFAKAVLKSISLEHPRIMKNYSSGLVDDIHNNKHAKIGIENSNRSYSSNLFEHYFLNEKDIFDYFCSFYFKHTPTLVVSFHDKKTIYKTLNTKVNVITVPYNNHYDKLDDVFSQISEFEGGVDYCLMDCSSLGLALSGKIWERLDMSVIDLGKTINFTKTYNASSRNEK